MGSFEQGFEENAKQDTVFLSKSTAGVIAEMVDDRSQKSNDIDNSGATYFYSAAGSADSSRFAVFTELAAEFVLDGVLDTDNFTFAKKRSAGGSSQEWELRSTGGLLGLFVGSGGLQGTLTIPGLSGTASKIAVGWSMRNNPDGSGASAKESLLYAYNLTTGAFDMSRIVHPTITVTTDELIVGAQTTAGANAVPSATYWRSFRFSTGRFHTHTEFFEDLCVRSATPVVTSVKRFEALVPDKASALGDDAEYAGPVHSLVAAAHRRLDLRLAGPILNELFVDPPTYDYDFLPAPWKKAMTGDSTYTLMGQFLWRRPIPNTVNKLLARVFVQTWVTSGAAVKFEARLISFNKLPTVNDVADEQAIAYEQYYRTVTRTVDDGTGATAGAWLTFAFSKIARTPDGHTYLALAISINDGSRAGNAANFRFKVKALTVDPLLDQVAGGLPDDVMLQP